MRAFERDVDVIKTLLAPGTWTHDGYSEVEARQRVAALALAWYCGANVQMVCRLRPRDWRPGGEDRVSFSAGPIASFRRQPPDYSVPLLEAPRAIVDAAATVVAGAGMGGETLLGTSARGSSLRVALKGLSKALPRLSGERVQSLRDLMERYRRYLLASDEDPKAVGWLIRLAGHYSEIPSQETLRALLERTHPAPRAERWMFR